MTTPHLTAMFISTPLLLTKWVKTFYYFCISLEKWNQ